MKTRRSLFGTVTQMMIGAMAAPAFAREAATRPTEVLPPTGHIQVLKDGAGGFIFQRNGEVFKHIKAEVVLPQARRVYHIDCGSMSPAAAQQHLTMIRDIIARR
jgi:hypothetical protein